MKALNLSTGCARRAIRLASALLLAVCASAPAVAHEKEAVDKAHDGSGQQPTSKNESWRECAS
jgi:hypothetical protein